jgi:hemoglobin-like flavoprotein
MEEAELELFHDSLSRCSCNPRFLECFYDLLLAASPEVRHKFRQTDFLRQRRILRSSLYLIMLAADGHTEGQAHLERIAARHSKADLDIAPPLYDLWLDCLIQAVKQYDPYCTAEMERAWRRMMERGIAVMKSRYETDVTGS